jgi:hypothetical protein
VTSETVSSFGVLDLQFVAEPAEGFVEAGLVDVGLLDDVGESADEVPGAGQFAQQAAVVHFALVKQLGGVKHVLDVDEDAQALGESAGNESGRCGTCATVHEVDPFCVALHAPRC